MNRRRFLQALSIAPVAAPLAAENLAAGGFFTNDVRTQRVTEAQCLAIIELAPDKSSVRCLSPEGQWYPRRPVQ
jgi:hypothetical protein